MERPLAELVSEIWRNGQPKTTWWMMPAIVSKKCMIEGCYFGATGKRGLCPKCYGRAKKIVESGDSTWEKMVERGLCTEERDPFDDAYSRAMEGE